MVANAINEVEQHLLNIVFKRYAKSKMKGLFNFDLHSEK